MSQDPDEQLSLLDLSDIEVTPVPEPKPSVAKRASGSQSDPEALFTAAHGEGVAPKTTSTHKVRPRAAAKPVEALVAHLPIAHVVISSPVPHLDQVFDYGVPESMAGAVAGTRVTVPFSGRQLDGIVVSRSQESSFQGNLQRVKRLVSPEVVVSAEIMNLARQVAQRNASGLYDVLRLAVPSRHARAEASASTPVAAPALVGERALSASASHAWGVYRGGVAFCQRLAAGESPRAAWSALPGVMTELQIDRGTDIADAETADRETVDAVSVLRDATASETGGLTHWIVNLVVAVAHCLASGRGSIVVVPDAKVLRQVKSIFSNTLGKDTFVVLEAESGAEVRYREFLRVSRGEAKVVLGTRSAIYAPVRDLGLIAIWDDADHNHVERMAPYAHVRDVASIRAHQVNCGLLLGSYSRSIEAQHLVKRGWLVNLVADRADIRSATPTVSALDDVIRTRTSVFTRVPQHAIRVIREALKHGPVLVQVPRGGFVPALKCADCAARPQCGTCHGPLQQGEDNQVTCAWCARPTANFVCVTCDGTQLQAAIVGVERTAREIERMFPAARVKRSDAAGQVLGTVTSEPALVLATPGAEPIAEGGYVAALLLDGWAFLSRQEFGAELAAVRRWMNAAALVRASSAGGSVIICADAEVSAVQSVIRWAPEWFSDQTLEQREQLSLPPVARMASITGMREAAQTFLSLVKLPEHVSVLGPVDVHLDPRMGAREGVTLQQFILQAPGDQAVAMAQALRAALRLQSAKTGVRATQVRSAFSSSRLSESGFAQARARLQSGGEDFEAGTASALKNAAPIDPHLVQIRLDPPDLGI